MERRVVSQSILLMLVAGLAPLAGAVLAVWRGYLPLKTGFRIQRSSDPLEFWGCVIILAGIGLYCCIRSALDLLPSVS